MKMVAHYDDYNEASEWSCGGGQGVILHLDHEYDYVLDSSSAKRLNQHQSIRARPLSGCVLLIVWPSESLCSNNRKPRSGNWLEHLS